MTDCTRCGGAIENGDPTMCNSCIRSTPGTDECPICSEYREEICGYHATCLWYCPDCGYIRRVGNNPVRPGANATVGCYNHPFNDGESHRMVRLTYTSTASDRLRQYINDGRELATDGGRVVRDSGGDDAGE